MWTAIYKLLNLYFAGSYCSLLQGSTLFPDISSWVSHLTEAQGWSWQIHNDRLDFNFTTNFWSRMILFIHTYICVAKYAQFCCVLFGWGYIMSFMKTSVMEMLSTLLALSGENSPVSSGFSSRRVNTFYFYVCLNKLLNKQLNSKWF